MNVDVIVVGAGIVGASFALQARDLQVAVIDPNPVPSVALDGEYDCRVYAITPANMASLESLAVFQAQDRGRLTEIHGMEIFADKKSKLEFSARTVQRSELATMVEHRLLATRLQQRLNSAEQVQMISHATGKVLEIGANGICVTLDDGTALTAALLVGADGGDSWVRSEGGFSLREKDYEQVALVANFICQRPHGNIARQWFVDQGVLAWLPLGEKHISIVWSVATPRGLALSELPPDAFSREVNAAGDGTLGDMTLVSSVARFPLRALRSDNMVKPHVALMGDAAHVIHPLAGQGLNLGLQDAHTLAQVLANMSAPEGVGDIAVLRRYERARAEAIAAMHGVTDGLQWLFAADSTLLAALRNGGLRLTDKMSWLKKLLIRHAIG